LHSGTCYGLIFTFVKGPRCYAVLQNLSRRKRSKRCRYSSVCCSTSCRCETTFFVSLALQVPQKLTGVFSRSYHLANTTHFRRLLDTLTTSKIFPMSAPLHLHPQLFHLTSRMLPKLSARQKRPRRRPRKKPIPQMLQNFLLLER